MFASIGLTCVCDVFSKSKRRDDFGELGYETLKFYGEKKGEKKSCTQHKLVFDDDE